MTTDIDFVSHIRAESARFLDALRPAPSGSRVPTCPDWDVEDLLWHLTEVQWFWGEIVRKRLTESADVDALDLPRPDGRDQLLHQFEASSAALADVLESTPADTKAWTWAEEQTVGFIRRRQAHEALIHRVDAEVTVEHRTPLDTKLCTDGVDEALKVMYGGLPSWGRFVPDDGQSVRFEATDAKTTWLVLIGRFSGTDPGDDKTYDEPDINCAAFDNGGQTAATIRATAADLNCWLWHRPTFEPVELEGNSETHRQLARIISVGIN